MDFLYLMPSLSKPKLPVTLAILVAADTEEVALEETMASVARDEACFEDILFVCEDGFSGRLPKAPLSSNTAAVPKAPSESGPRAAVLWLANAAIDHLTGSFVVFLKAGDRIATGFGRALLSQSAGLASGSVLSGGYVVQQSAERFDAAPATLVGPGFPFRAPAMPISSCVFPVAALRLCGPFDVHLPHLAVSAWLQTAYVAGFAVEILESPIAVVWQHDSQPDTGRLRVERVIALCDLFAGLQPHEAHCLVHIIEGSGVMDDAKSITERLNNMHLNIGLSAALVEAGRPRDEIRAVLHGVDFEGLSNAFGCDAIFPNSGSQAEALPLNIALPTTARGDAVEELIEPCSNDAKRFDAGAIWSLPASCVLKPDAVSALRSRMSQCDADIIICAGADEPQRSLAAGLFGSWSLAECRDVLVQALELQGLIRSSWLVRDGFASLAEGDALLRGDEEAMLQVRRDLLARAEALFIDPAVYVEPTDAANELGPMDELPDSLSPQDLIALRRARIREDEGGLTSFSQGLLPSAWLPLLAAGDVDFEFWLEALISDTSPEEYDRALRHAGGDDLGYLLASGCKTGRDKESDGYSESHAAWLAKFHGHAIARHFPPVEAGRDPLSNSLPFGAIAGLLGRAPDIDVRWMPTRPGWMGANSFFVRCHIGSMVRARFVMHYRNYMPDQLITVRSANFLRVFPVHHDTDERRQRLIFDLPVESNDLVIEVTVDQLIDAPNGQFGLCVETVEVTEDVTLLAQFVPPEQLDDPFGIDVSPYAVARRALSINVSDETRTSTNRRDSFVPLKLGMGPWCLQPPAGSSAPAEFPMSWDEAVEWLRGQPDKKLLVDACYYDDPIKDAAERFWQSEEWAETQKLLPGEAGRAADIGAGRGIASYALARDGWQVTAVELDDSPLTGRQAMHDLVSTGGVSFHIEDGAGEKLPFDDKSLDLVLCRQVLHHADDLPGFLREIARVLRPGGVCVATREHVLERHADKTAFLNGHPLHNLYGGENAFLLKDYTDAFEGAGLHFEMVLSPSHPINFFPAKLSDVRAQMAEAYGAAPSALDDAILRRLIDCDLTPGRAFSFVAAK
ncbi:MAG: class I SAM-dependent methyltransferase [Pseudomonadota bacterium]